MNILFKIAVICSCTLLFLSAGLLFLDTGTQLNDRPEIHQPSEGALRISVLNGCGREGLATLFADRIRALGYDVVNGQGGNADSFDFERSVVLDRKGDKRRARKVADDLGIALVVDQYAANPYVIEDVVVILGRDWNILSGLKGVQSE